jgi:hypothetical protein
VVKNWGAATAFLALVALVSVAAWLDVSAPYHHCRGADECGQPFQDHHKPADYMAGPLALGQFAETNDGAITAVATILIAAFTIVLAIRTGGLFKETAGLRAIATEQRAYMLRSIIATEKLAEAAHRTAALAREEFNATHRPHLNIRDVCLDGKNIAYLLINNGTAEATIVESWIMVEYVPGNEILRPLRSYGHDCLGRLHFAVGEVKDRTYFPPQPLNFFCDNILYFVGTIVYSDPAGHRRRTVFRRRWDTDRQGFFSVDDPDQEYSD